MDRAPRANAVGSGRASPKTANAASSGLFDKIVTAARNLYMPSRPDEIALQFGRAIEQIAAFFVLADDEGEEIDQYLALRRQQRAKAGFAGIELRDVVGDEIVKKFCRVRLRQPQRRRDLPTL